MGILGIGVDVLHVSRLAALIERRSAQRLASRILSAFSVKEAAYKAIYPVSRPTWKDLTLHGMETGPGGRKPRLEFQPSVPLPEVGQIHASVSHDGNYVFTTVIVERFH
ncbi:hypothetical protein WOLCODRAFT_89238 [Wolfiporia cocos MD-104 SS10]|uniref:Uncharacterized protein n=1 Tax=Wolfiporia cocos (strain MD-104) TaxID=742152 RepID=A0A2H3JXC4_WOLCO|nr:hypothetical protein WOLCODRAFT_89238 [Wolfiporia cocos MD-104 SS10]